jgi:hypothetical protein
MRSACRSVASLVLLLVTFCLVDRAQPLVRNSLVYARAAWNVADAGFDPRAVVADSKLSYDKPIGFAWMAAPLVARLGAHDGLRIASLAGTVAYLLATLFFARVMLPERLRERGGTLLLWLASFGPLVAYQAWSAHPDSWFAALFVVAIALTHQIAVGEDAAVPRRTLLLGVTLLVAFLLKNYALVLVPACGLYFLSHRAAIARDGRSVRRRVVWCGPLLLIVAAFIVAARFGMNPLSRLEGEGGGADQFAFKEIGSIWWKTMSQVGVALALQFHATLFFTLRRTTLSRDVALPALCFGAIYVAGLLPFPTAFYNMRYFLPLFPLVALAIVRGIERPLDVTATAPRGALFTAIAIVFLAVNGATTLVFNVPALYDRVAPRLPDTHVTWLEGGPPLALLDNLRMEQHRQQAAWLDAVDANVEAGALLYMVDVVYYRDAQQHVFERDGRIRSDVTTRYVGRRDFHPNEAKFYVWSFTGAPLQLERFGRVTDLGHRLFRVEKKSG